MLFHGFRANDKACVEYTYLSTSFSNKNGILNLYNVNQNKLKRSSCWPGGTEGQYEDRVVRQEDISMGINPALDYLSMPSSGEIKAGAATET